MWTSAYRLKVLAGEQPAWQDFGGLSCWRSAPARDGSDDGVAAGCLTRFLGVPWQTDHTSCNSAADYFPCVPVDADVLGTASRIRFWHGNHPRAAAIAPLGQATQQQTFKHLMNRVDGSRDIRGTDHYDRLSNIDCGMVRARHGVAGEERACISAGAISAGRAGRRDNNGPIDVTADPKYHAVEDMESLFLPQTTAGLAQRRGARKTAPRRSGPIARARSDLGRAAHPRSSWSARGLPA